MRKLCPNFDREDGLETVLEVPIPEEMFGSSNKKSWQTLMAWIRPNSETKSTKSLLEGRNTAEIQLLLGVVGAPLIPFPIHSDDHHHHPFSRNIIDYPIEASMAKYIVQQYIGAVGGERALNSVESVYAMGKVRMWGASEVSAGEGCGNNKVAKFRNGGEIGGFVLWQKRPHLWCLELVVSGCKISAGSDGTVAWRQTPWHQSHASRGCPRPLRRFLQGLDPKSTANLFLNSVCIGEKTINDQDCFVLKLGAESSSLRARSTSNMEIIRHTVWGYFSQKTGLLVQIEDSHLLRIKASEDDGDGIFWETTMESAIQDYRTIDGINIAHGGKTAVTLLRFGESTCENHSRTRMEEVWTIEEFDFNIKGLSVDCFLPPSDLKKGEEEDEGCGIVASNSRLPPKIRSASFRISAYKVAAVDDVDRNSDDDIHGEEEL